ncbi:MAG: HDOD domain-containing protein [Rhodothermales bacterium]
MYTTLSSAKKDPNLLPFRFALKAFIADERLKIPVLPDVVGKVIALINHPKADANTLARLIHKDQALAGYVLRVSNSPIFAGAREISTLRQAIARIGAKTLGKIALSVTMQGKVFKAKGYENEIKDIWRKTLTAGAFAQDIGHILGESSESLYLCGLLHTVGKPVILQALQDLSQELDMELSHPAGMSLVKEFHHLVGYKVAEQWKLPDAVKNACVYYLDPESSESNLKEVRITYLAHQFSLFIDEDPEDEVLDALADSPSTAALRIKKDHLVKLVTRLEKVRALLEAMSLA